MLSEKQNEIVNSDDSRIVVKACPGSGKTYSVSARIAKLLQQKLYKYKGIAVISFTNVAAEEIKNTLQSEYDIQITYPHFIGTIDTFINQHVFLPFGHLVLGCTSRPEIVGTEYNQWYNYDASIRNYYSKKISDPNYYFDKVSFNRDGSLLRLLPYQSYHFGKSDWDNMYKASGGLKKVISDIINVKWEHFRAGKATQSDANYFSLQLLEKYPQILKSLSSKYSHLVIDEAQDTTEIQMSIIDRLDNDGIENILFVGDPDQAIFEWNTADAELFMQKYNDINYSNIELEENRRSSDKICSLLNKIGTIQSVSVADVKLDPNSPEVMGYDSHDEIQQIKNSFIKKCDELGIETKNRAILFRGKSFGEEHFELIPENSIDHPWKNKHFYVRDIVQGKFLMEKGAYKDSLKLLEKGFYKLQNPDLAYISRTYLRNQINQKGFRLYRSELFDFVNLLPSTENKNLNDWVNETNVILEEKGYSKLQVSGTKASVEIKKIFHRKDAPEYLPYMMGTIHSVKGQTFDAVLLFLRKKATKNYSALLSPTYNEADESKKRKDKEELRLVYVACSRPKRLLWVAVPNEDITLWKNYFGLNS